MTSCRIRAFVFLGAAALAACSSPTSTDKEIPESPSTPVSASSARDLPASDPAPSPAVSHVASSTPAPVSPAPTGARTYVVKKGDTLMGIARQYYGGDASKWQKILAANRDKIADKNHIKVGQELVIPD